MNTAERGWDRWYLFRIALVDLNISLVMFRRRTIIRPSVESTGMSALFRRLSCRLYLFRSHRRSRFALMTFSGVRNSFSFLFFLNSIYSVTNALLAVLFCASALLTFSPRSPCWPFCGSSI